MVFPLKKCCAQCYPTELSTGALLVGCFSVVYSIAAIFLSAISLINNDYLADRICYIFAYYDYERIAIIFCWLIIVGKSIGLISAGLLIAGTVKRKILFVIPWLLVELISIIIFLVVLIFVVTKAGMDGLAEYTFIGLIVIVAGSYKWTCVYAFCKELKEESGALQTFTKNIITGGIFKATPPVYRPYEGTGKDIPDQ